MTDTPPYRTKLIEVGLPLVAINKACAREKVIRHGHPSTLHLYWARRPLAACRAVLFASFVNDPSSDPLYEHKTEDEIRIRRQELHDFLAELVLWESTKNKKVINRARAEIASSIASSLNQPDGIEPSDLQDLIIRNAKSEVVNRFLTEFAPPVHDPFTGGGAISLEAQRLGLRSYASDLNPVALVINKALLEIPQNFIGQPPMNVDSRSSNIGTMTWNGTQGLSEDINFYGKWIISEAQKRVGKLYPKVHISEELAKNQPNLERYKGQDMTVIAWIWARTVPSPDPAMQGAQTPLVKSWVVSKKKGKRVVRVKPEINQNDGTICYSVECGGNVDIEPSVNRAIGRCLFTDSVIPNDFIKEAGQNGGFGNHLMAAVVESANGREFIGGKWIDRSLESIEWVDKEVDSTVPFNEAHYMGMFRYGLTTPADVFLPQTKQILNELQQLLSEAEKLIHADCVSYGLSESKAVEYVAAVRTYLGITISKCTDYWSNLCSWHNSKEQLRNVFARQAMSMTWDFAEANPFSSSSGSWINMLNWVVKVVRELNTEGPPTVIEQFDARVSAERFAESICTCTDPPYYDNVPYADISDFFYHGLRNSLAKFYPELFATVSVPKQEELVADPKRQGSKKNAREFFEKGMKDVFHSCGKKQNIEIPMTIFYAFKQNEQNSSNGHSGWATFLDALVNHANLVVTATFPMRTELATRTRSIGANALASSILLTCRPRMSVAGITTRTDFVNELKVKLSEDIKILQQTSIAPVDLQQAAIGPGISVFSKYSKVIEANGNTMSVVVALELINQILDEILTEQEGDFDSDTRFAAVWFEQYCFENGEYGTAQVLATAKSISVEGVVESGIFYAKGGLCRLLKPKELSPNWEPEVDDRLTVWECTHYLCRELELNGLGGAAELVRRLGGLAESGRDLAYRLYSICDKNNWSLEGQIYNELVTAWPDIQHLAAQESAVTTKEENASLFE